MCFNGFSSKDISQWCQEQEGTRSQVKACLTGMRRQMKFWQCYKAEKLRRNPERMEPQRREPPNLHELSHLCYTLKMYIHRGTLSSSGKATGEWAEVSMPPAAGMIRFGVQVQPWEKPPRKKFDIEQNKIRESSIYSLASEMFTIQ